MTDYEKMQAILINHYSQGIVAGVDNLAVALEEYLTTNKGLSIRKIIDFVQAYNIDNKECYSYAFGSKSVEEIDKELHPIK